MSSDPDALNEQQLIDKIDNIDEYIEKLYCEIIERLTKICALSESEDYANAESVKTLAKYMYKFEVSLERLVMLIKSGKCKSFSNGTLPLGLLKWVNESKHPSDWILSNAYNRRNSECNKLMSACQSINHFKASILDALQKENFKYKL